MTGATSGEGTAHPSEAPEFTQIVGGVRVLCVMFCKSLLHQVTLGATTIYKTLHIKHELHQQSG
jgi:hypothetical protein